MRTSILAVAFSVMAALGVIVAQPAQAAVACSVTYTKTWDNGGAFGANVTINNLGDPLNPWTLRFTWPGNQQVGQGWNGTWTQSGQNVTVTAPAYAPVLSTGASVTVGFNGTYSGANNAPTSYSINGVTCGGPGTPSPTPTPTSSTGWNPPANLVNPLNQVWSHVESTYGNLYGFRNYGWDQVMANRGYVNYCVRWDSPASVTAAQRDAIHAALQRQFKKWMDVMAGHNAWPYTDVPVRVVGWAVRDRAQLQWTDNSVDVYVGDIRENAPQCAPPCGRFFNQGGTYPNCPGGVARHYDMSLWLTAGMGGGAGGDWGQRMGSEYFMNNINASNMHILLHEIGHTFGLDDFYDWTPTGVGGFLMKAGSASQITEFDAWMLRDFWRHVKNRYGL